MLHGKLAMYIAKQWAVHTASR